MTHNPKRTGAAFTLVELLVVISIIGLLVAILVPGLQGGRRLAKRAACATNLRSIGQGLRLYLNESNDYLPVVAFLPSAEVEEENPRPTLSGVLLPFIYERDNRPPPDPGATPQEQLEDELEGPGDEVFHCPADVPGRTKRDPPLTGKSYFQSENSSYMFNTRLHRMTASGSLIDGEFIQPVKLSEVVRSERARHMFGGQAAEEQIWLMRDYIPFHGKAGTAGSTNYLYVDGHVADLER